MQYEKNNNIYFNILLKPIKEWLKIGKLLTDRKTKRASMRKS